MSILTVDHIRLPELPLQVRDDGTREGHPRLVIGPVVHLTRGATEAKWDAHRAKSLARSRIARPGSGWTSRRRRWRRSRPCHRHHQSVDGPLEVGPLQQVTVRRQRDANVVPGPDQRCRQAEDILGNSADRCSGVISGVASRIFIAAQLPSSTTRSRFAHLITPAPFSQHGDCLPDSRRGGLPAPLAPPRASLRSC